MFINTSSTSVFSFTFHNHFLHILKVFSQSYLAHAVRRWLPTAAARVRFRAACGVCGGQSGTGGRFSPSISVSPANNSTNFSIIIITRGWHNRPISGRSAEWTKLDSTPHYTNLKKMYLVHIQDENLLYMCSCGKDNRPAVELKVGTSNSSPKCVNTRKLSWLRR
jgi:hypothetical protein